jgi:competence protein ComFC
MKIIVPAVSPCSVLAWVAPLRCVVCAGPVEAYQSWPLCAACAATLVVYSGRRCSICGKPICSELIRCMRCRSATVAFDEAFPLYAYSGVVRKLLIAYKSKKRWSLARFLADCLAPEIIARFPSYTIVPVPPRPGKRRREGWDQVDLLVKILEKKWLLPVARLLARKKGGNEQKTLDREGRRTNVMGRYTFLPGSLDSDGRLSSVTIPGRILLLDDIMTTGATLSECASVLKERGNDRVAAMVVAAD